MELPKAIERVTVLSAGAEGGREVWRNKANRKVSRKYKPLEKLEVLKKEKKEKAEKAKKPKAKKFAKPKEQEMDAQEILARIEKLQSKMLRSSGKK